MRYGLVSDIHSNLAALEAVLQDMEQHGTLDGLLCMGDIVGYGPQPNEVIQRLKEYQLFSIIGNHDMAVLGLLDLGDFNRDAVDANVWTRYQLTNDHASWLESLGPLARFDERVTLAHGSPSEPVWEYLTTPHSAARNFEAFDTPLCFVGHTHLPRVFRLREDGENQSDPDPFEIMRSGLLRVEMRIPEPNELVELGLQRMIVNPGSVGQPRDGDKRAAYAIYDDAEMTLMFGRAAYEVGQTQELMRQAQLPSRLIMRLDYGM